ncbi:acyl-CoA carboxylase subunit epsilon [Streptomyces sp. NPDC012474]|uniref:acyl-CoA carboxylase subunit epsilon n=1 Tax=Streptomyces sp. NPDC012474 TaxID=3364836 RepID=UPI0036EB81B3
MSGPTVRVVRGAPAPEELAALITALHALTAYTCAARPSLPPAAPWPRPSTPLTTPAPAWSSRHRPAWQGT